MTDTAVGDGEAIDSTLADAITDDDSAAPDTRIADSAIEDTGADTGIDTMVGDAGADSTEAGAANNIVFVTSTVRTGNLGGVAGADAICNAAATAAGLAGNFRALLSTTTSSARARLGGARGWVRVDGLPFADTLDDLFVNHVIYNPIGLTETGAKTNQAIWTASARNGNLFAAPSCSDWTSASSGSAAVGRSGGGPAQWITSNTLACSGTAALACFGIDSSRPLVVSGKLPGKRIFTSASLSPSGGRASLDAACGAEALAAGLTGTYRALVATTTASASALLLTGAAYVRPDGQLVGTGADIIARSLRSGPWQSAGGAYLLGPASAWTGSGSLTAIGTAATTCADWTSASAASTGSTGSQTDIGAFWNGGSGSCDIGRAVTCLEQ